MSLTTGTASDSTRKCMAVFIPMHALLFLGLFMIAAQLFYPRTGVLEFHLADTFFKGWMPYRDYPVEYPPLSLLFFLVPRIFAGTLGAFVFAFALQMLLVDVAVMLLLVRLAPRLEASPWHILGAYTLLVIGAGPLVMSRYDLWPALFVLAALWAFSGGRTKLAWAALALNVTAKLFGVVITPLFVIHYLVNRQYRRLVEGALAFLGTSLLIAVPWLFTAPSGLLGSLGYHLQRPLHSESSYGTLLLLGKLFHVNLATIAYASGSWNVYSPLADRLAAISGFITALALMAVYVAFYFVVRRQKTNQTANTSRTLSHFSALALAVLLVTSKVLSAQYLIWLCPLLPLLSLDRKYWVWAAFLLAGVLTQYVFPYKLAGFIYGEAAPVIAMALRNLALLVMALLLVPRCLIRPARVLFSHNRQMARGTK